MNQIEPYIMNNGSMIGAVVSVVIILALTFFSLRLTYKVKKESKLPDMMVSIASGIMITILFLHLLREVYEVNQDGPIDTVVVALFVFFVLSLINHSHAHSHHDHDVPGEVPGADDNKFVKHVSKGLMIGGQSVHSLADGIVIIAGWIASPLTGILTSLAIALHHIPMMLGISNKYKNVFSRRFIYTYTLYATGAMLVGILFARFIYEFVAKEYFLAIAAASFAHIAILDMFGHVRESKCLTKKSKILLILIGILIAYTTEMTHGH